MRALRVMSPLVLLLTAGLMPIGCGGAKRRELDEFLERVKAAAASKECGVFIVRVDGQGIQSKVNIESNGFSVYEAPKPFRTDDGMYFIPMRAYRELQSAAKKCGSPKSPVGAATLFPSSTARSSQ